MSDGTRAYPVEAGSLEKVLDFLAMAYRRYSGTIDRARAGCPQPGKDAAGRVLQYFAAEHDGRTIGAVGLCADGTVGDWALEPSPEASRAFPRLLDLAERWAIAHQAHALELVSHASDAPSEKMMLSLGFRPVAPPVTSIRVLDFSTLLTLLARGAHETAAALAPFVLHLHLERGADPPGAQPDMAVSVSKDTVRVEHGAPADADAVATTTATALTRFLFSPGGDRAFLADHLAVSPLAAVTRVHALVSLFQVGRSWFSPPAEHR